LLLKTNTKFILFFFLAEQNQKEKAIPKFIIKTNASNSGKSISEDSSFCSSSSSSSAEISFYSNTDLPQTSHIHNNAHITLSNYSNKQSITYDLDTINELDVAEEPIYIKNYPWKHTNILALIHAYDTHKEKFTSIHYKNKNIWKFICQHIHAEIVQSGEAIVPSEKQVHSKWRNLKRTYIQHIDACNQSGSERKSPPPYFKEIGDVLGYKANVNPEFTISSDGDKKRKNVETETVKENSAKKMKNTNKKKMLFWMR